MKLTTRMNLSLEQKSWMKLFTYLYILGRDIVQVFDSVTNICVIDMVPKICTSICSTVWILDRSAVMLSCKCRKKKNK